MMIKNWMYILGPVSASEICSYTNLDQSLITNILYKLEATGLVLRGNFKNSSDLAPDLQWCERRLLARIHKLTLDKLRQEIKPATREEFMRWLLKWQHVDPANKQKGEAGLLAIIKQLQGFELAANAWESKIFKQRMHDYSPNLLSRLCLKGIVGWGRFSLHPALEPKEPKNIVARSTALMSFYVREDSAWLPLESTQDPSILGLSSSAQLVYNFLKQRGASFFSEILGATKFLPTAIEDALWQLLCAGLVAADDIENLRILINKKRRADRRRSLRNNVGRWSILHRNYDDNENNYYIACAWLLLKRYGVVFRELLMREKNMPPWFYLIRALRTLEDRGEIRGGRFVDGFAGEQFALPYAVESLRALRKEKQEKLQLNISAVDPLNLLGIILPGERVAAISGKELSLSF
jgi:ATP-dependent Lhr-like helicase